MTKYKRHASLATPFLLCLLSLSAKVNGWGHEGHCIVANIAYSRLTPDVQEAVKSILNYTLSDSDLGYGVSDTHGGKDDLLNTSPLAAVANWADKVRFTTKYHWSTPLHFVDVRDDMIDGGCPCTRSVGDDGDMRLLMNDDNDGDDDQSCTIHSSCWFVYDRDCAEDFCAVGGIANYTSRLVDSFHPSSAGGDLHDPMLRGSRQSSSEGEMWSGWPAKEALMFLTHFIGDIHQPLHASRGSDRGGNSIHVHFDGLTKGERSYDARTGRIQKKGEWNLHSVWDDGLIDLAIQSMYSSSQLEFQKSVIVLVEEAETSGLIDTWLRCTDGISKHCPALWAEESFEDALKWAYSDEEGSEVLDGAVLSEDYFETRLHVVRRRLAAAGVRLGAVLDNALGQAKHASDSNPKLAEILTSLQKPMMLLS